jgi:hypothetical protein
MYSQYNIIVIVIVIILILWFINRLTSVQHFKDMLCVNCSGGSDISYTGVNSNITGCMCMYDYGWNNLTCTTCPGGSHGYNSSGIHSNVTGCNCNYDYGWNNTTCMACIGDSHTYYINPSGTKANITGCYCAYNSAWNIMNCITCIGGSSTSYTGLKANVTGCNCRYNASWTGNNCYDCQDISNLTNLGATANAWGCYCPQSYGWYNNTNCTGCIGGSDPSYSGCGTNIGGCLCPYNNIWNIYNDSKCYACPSGRVSDWPNQHQPIQQQTAIPGCYCPLEYPRYADDNCIYFGQLCNYDGITRWYYHVDGVKYYVTGRGGTYVPSRNEIPDINIDKWLPGLICTDSANARANISVCRGIKEINVSRVKYRDKVEQFNPLIDNGWIQNIANIIRLFPDPIYSNGKYYGYAIYELTAKSGPERYMISDTTTESDGEGTTYADAVLLGYSSI